MPLPEFDYLLLVGSSTTYETFTVSPVLGRQEQNVRLAFTSLGRDVPVINKAVSGSSIADLDANISTYMTQLGGPVKKVAVLINIGSNDIEATPYESMLQAEKDAMLAGLNSIYNKVLAFGFTPIIATVHSRQSAPALYEDWAEQMYRPLIESLHPHWFSGGLATFDYCRLYFENKDVPNWWRDGVHPLEALGPMQQYTAQRFISKAALPAINPADRVIFYFNAASSGQQYMGGMNPIPAGASANATVIHNSLGVLIEGATFGWAGAVGTSFGFRPNLGDWDIGLAHNAVQGCNLYGNAGATITFTAALGVEYADRTGNLRVTASSNAANRLTRITCGVESAVVNASGPGVQVIELPFMMDGSGGLVFTAQAEGASAFSNVSGVEFVFD